MVSAAIRSGYCVQLSKLHTQPLNTVISVLSFLPGLSGSWHGSWNCFLRSLSGLQQPHAVVTVIFSTSSLCGREGESVAICLQHFRLTAFHVYEPLSFLQWEVQRKEHSPQSNGSVNCRTTNSVGNRSILSSQDAETGVLSSCLPFQNRMDSILVGPFQLRPVCDSMISSSVRPQTSLEN